MAFNMERIMELRKVALLTLIVVVLLSGAVLAGGWQYSGVGARAKAMGGAYRGIANDGNGAYYNPAGLAFLEKNIVNVTGEIFSPRPTVTPDFNSNGYGFGYLNGQKCYGNDQNYAMGAASLFFRPKKDSKLVMGMAFFQGYDQNSNMDLFQLTPAYNSKIQISEVNHRSNLDVVTFQPTLATKFSQDRLAVGIGLQIHRGDILADQVRLLDNPYPYPLNVRPYDKFVELYSIDGYGYGVGGNVGFQYKVSPKSQLEPTMSPQRKSRWMVIPERTSTCHLMKGLRISTWIHKPTYLSVKWTAPTRVRKFTEKVSLKWR